MKPKVKLPKHIPQYVNTQSYKNYRAELFTVDLANRGDRLQTIFERRLGTKLNILNDVFLDSQAFMKSVKTRSRSCPFVNKGARENYRSLYETSPTGIISRNRAT